MRRIPDFLRHPRELALLCLIEFLERLSFYGMRAILVLFDRGDTLLEGLQEVVTKEKIDTASITGGIGSFQRVHLHTITTTGFPTADKHWNFTGPIELASVQGPVISGDVHAHIAVFDWDSKQTYIGHLEPGSVVAYRAEVSLMVLEGVKTERYNDADGISESGR